MTAKAKLTTGAVSALVLLLAFGAILSRSGVTVCYEDGGRLPRKSRRSGKPHSGVRLFSGLPAGRVRVNLRRGDGRRSERLVDLRPGETTEVVFPDD